MSTPITTYRKFLLVFTVCLLLGLWTLPAMGQAGAAGAQLPPPTETAQTTVEGVPTCPAGMTAFRPQSNGVDDIVGGTFSDDELIVSVVISGLNVEWTSNYGVDVFLVQGSDSASVYTYVPEATSGSGTTPPGPEGQGQVELTAYQFCYDDELRVDHTATGAFTRTYTWGITGGNDRTYTGFIGDAAFDHDYAVTLDQSVTDSQFVISGEVTVYNDSPVQADNVSVSAVINAGGVDDSVIVSCPATTLAAGQDGTAGSMVCTYAHPVNSAVAGTSTVTTASSNLNSGSEAVDVVFGPPEVIGYPSVHVTDNWAGELGAATDDESFPYSRSLQCPPDKPAYAFGVYVMPSLVNTASIREIPDATASATVDLTCYAPLVSKTAAGTYDERYTWVISKTVNPPSQSGFSGSGLPWSWTVLTGESFVNVQFAVSGTIILQNPTGAPGTVTIDVSEALDNALDERTVATADCDTALAGNQTTLTLAPGTTGTCSYSALPTNTTATLQSGFASETLYYDWLLTWTKYGPTQEGFELHGDITVTNPAPVEMIVRLDDSMNDGTPVALQPGPACAFDPASGLLTVPATGTAICPYTGTPPDASSEVNTVTVTLNRVVFAQNVGVLFTLDQIFDETANISDPSLGFSQIVTGSGLQPFTEYHDCPTDQANYTDGVDDSFVDINTATLTGSDGFSSEATAHHAVICYAPVVTTSAETSWSRDWTWDIAQSASDAAVGPLVPGQDFLMDSTATVHATRADSDFQVWGTIWISNPNPGASMELVGVTDMVSPGIGAETVCPALVIPAGGSMSCTYRAALPDASSYGNTAAVGIHYGSTAWFSNIPITPVTFSPVPSSETDECVMVSDTLYGPLFNGLQVCATGTGDNTVAATHSIDVGRDVCGPYTARNVASFETNDNHETGSAAWDVPVDITCSETCTLSPGYWASHTIYGPAAYPNSTWASVGGPDAPFFLSGQSWYQVFRESRGGAGYYELARQYMAATLNTLQASPNGVVPPPEAMQALSDAEGYFSSHTIAQAERLPEDARNAAARTASILAQFNAGLLFTPPCDEGAGSLQ